MLPLALLAGSVPLAGQSTQSGFSVGATVSRSCQIDASPLAFGNYDPVARHATAPLDADTILVVTCTKGTPAAIALNAGRNASGGGHFMASGSERLRYDLYQDAGRGQRWGDAPGELLTLGPSDGNARSVHIYGRVPADQDVLVGTYSDTVVATVYF